MTLRKMLQLGNYTSYIIPDNSRGQDIAKTRLAYLALPVGELYALHQPMGAWAHARVF